MKYLCSLIILIFILQGCASKQPVVNKRPTNVDDIKDTKTSERFNDINILNKYRDKNAFKVFIDSDNKIKYVCYNNRSSCNYYNPKIHSYEQTQDINEDIVWVYDNGFSPNFSRYINDIQCGRGSMQGVFVLLNTKNLKNHNKRNLHLCYSRFTKLDSMQIGEKLMTSILTFGTTLITSGNMHTVKFDQDEFEEAVIESNLDNHQEKLFAIKNLHRTKHGFDVIYLNHKNLYKSLHKNYKRIKNATHQSDGVIFIDEENLNILSIINFKNYRSSDVINKISLQINDILKSMVFDSNNENLISYEDIEQYIPSRIRKPSLPPLPTLEKSEFETVKEFRQRVYDAVKQREDRIAQLQKEYNLKILQRNEYITNLENSYKEYLKENASQMGTMQQELKDNLGLLSKILFLKNTQGFDAKNFNYNAEIQKLYFEIYSKDKKYHQKVRATIPAKVAKVIKLDKSYMIEPVLMYKNRYLLLKGFNIIEPKSDNAYKVAYTHVNFKPMQQKVVITTRQEQIKQLLDTKKFKKHKQKNSSIVSKKDSEIWYIDVVNRMNSKVPKWFSHPDLNDTTIAYAQAETLEEAKIKALHDLALIHEVKVSATIESVNEFSNSLKNYHNVKKSITTKTNMKFSKNDYRVLRQEKVDGIWYVSLGLQ